MTQMPTDEELLATANLELCKLPHLQIAHDRVLLCNPDPYSPEYAAAWDAYLAAGGDNAMMTEGFDPRNWEQHRQKAGAE